MAELLDLDGEVLRDYLAGVTGWIAASTAGRSVHRILDVGAGTGTGTFALLERWPEAEVVALDVSRFMLDHLTGRAAGRGAAERVSTVQADLDTRWPVLSQVDLVWASSSLHHMADPDNALAEIRGVLRPAGLLAVTEMTSFPRFLPDDVGRGTPGLEARCHAALAHARAEQVPHQGSDWGSRLARAGFVLDVERTFDVHLDAPLAAAGRRYAELSLRQMRTGLVGLITPDDEAVLDALLDHDRPDSVLRRDDLTVRATRFAWLAHRP